MAEEFTVTLPIAALEELRCSICQGYLSCSPVRLLPNGNYICGACSPLNLDTPINRLVALEIFLCKTSFPCVFKAHGCPETLLFGRTANHQSNCVYKPFACPTKPVINCLWEGGTLELLQHCKDDHPSIVKKEAEFKLKLDEDTQNVLVVTADLGVFLVKYCYQAKEKILKYDVRFYTAEDGLEASFRMHLINDTDIYCKIGLKANDCSLFDETFYDMAKAKVLNIDKLLEALGEPINILFELKFNITELNNNGAMANVPDLIKTLRCYTCLNYLIPPLFELGGKTVCYNCGKGSRSSKWSTDQDLLRRVNEAMYPCQWRGCNFVGRSNMFIDHGLTCQFRQYCCVYLNCKTTFVLIRAAAHFLTHLHKNSVYMPDEITYNTTFACNYSRKDILTIKKRRIILIMHKMANRQHYIKIRPSREDSHLATATVEFEHAYCASKSKVFNVIFGTELKITLEDLPPCFKDTDELTVAIEL